MYVCTYVLYTCTCVYYTWCMSHSRLVLNAELVPDDPTTVVFTDNDTKVTVTIPASAFAYQQSTDMEGMDVIMYICIAT